MRCAMGGVLRLASCGWRMVHFRGSVSRVPDFDLGIGYMFALTFADCQFPAAAQ